MKLNFLKQSLNNSVYCIAASEGYSRCVQESVSFLSQCGVQTLSQRRLLSHFLIMLPPIEKSCVLQLSSLSCHISSKQEPPASCAL